LTVDYWLLANDMQMYADLRFCHVNAGKSRGNRKFPNQLNLSHGFQFGCFYFIFILDFFV